MAKYKEIQDLAIGVGGSAPPPIWDRFNHSLYIMNFLEFDLKPVLVTVTLHLEKYF